MRKISLRLLLAKNHLHIFHELFVQHIIYIQTTEHKIIAIWYHLALRRRLLLHYWKGHGSLERNDKCALFMKRMEDWICTEIFGNHVLRSAIVVKLYFGFDFIKRCAVIIDGSTWCHNSFLYQKLMYWAGITNNTFDRYCWSSQIILKRGFPSFAGLGTFWSR